MSMSRADTLLAALFEMPGSRTPSRFLLEQAVAAHAALLERAASSGLAIGGRLRRLSAMLDHWAVRRWKQRLLRHPVFIEGLHALADACPQVAQWRRSLGLPVRSNCRNQLTLDRCGLENTELTLQLRVNPHWCGTTILSTDRFGRIRFPLTDWSVGLYPPRGDPPAVLTNHSVTVLADQHCVRWSGIDSPDDPFLILSRDTCLRMLVRNAPELNPQRCIFLISDVQAKLHRAAALGSTGVVYEPVLIADGHSPQASTLQAEWTGAIVQKVLGAIRQHSPTIHQEFCELMHSIRGFSLPDCQNGVVQSFSDPERPGVMNFNLPYTDDSQPRVNPFCFTCFGHEFGHSKSYLIENILAHHGCCLLKNGEERIGPLPRYGRTISLRTLFQIPYTHLYEWTLLTDFLRGGLQSLPWDVSEDPILFGNDLKCEIEEAFDWIEERGALTPFGKLVLVRLRQLTNAAASRWTQRI